MRYTTGWLMAVTVAALGIGRGQTVPRLRVSENGRYFVTEGGAPFLYLADTAWGLFHFSREEADLYLKDRAAKKFTVIQAIVAHWGGLGSPNAYGQAVFLDKDPKRPNEQYFQHVDYVVDHAASLGLYVAMVPIWSNEYVKETGSAIDKPAAFSYGRYLGARYRNKPVIWILGGDYFADGVEEIWRSMAAGIAEGDGGTHLKTYHPKSPRSSAQWFHNDAWLAFNMLQTGHTIWNRNYDLVAEDWNRKPVKPVVDGEGGYEGIADGFVPGGKIEAHDVRRIAYCALFAGAAGYSYGGHGVWGYRGSSGNPQARGPAGGDSRHGPAPPFKDALQLPAASQMQHLRALLESRPMLARIPDQWLLANDYMGTVDRIQACRASDGSYAFIYTASGSKLHVRMVDRFYPKVSGKMVRASWFNPRTGALTVIGTLEKKDFMDFTPPSSGRGNDWVLVLDDAARNP
ncbi:MAG TPA: glycoside hydrolase family 140 protein [Bryobacteraceae bacterium]|nr:glycoside hydrolase family 140 protein [Bryobacteraceae bacterium]